MNAKQAARMAQKAAAAEATQKKFDFDLLIDPVSAPEDRFMMYVHGKSQNKAVMLG